MILEYTTFCKIVEFLFYLTFMILLFIGVKIYKNAQQMSNIPGLWQVVASPIKIPLISPYLYMSCERKLLEWVEKFGDSKSKTMRISHMFGNTVVVQDRAMLKELLLTKANCFEKPRNVYDSFTVFGENILSAPNQERWKKHHNICYTAFSSKNLEYVAKIATESVDLLISQKWKSQV